MLENILDFMATNWFPIELSLLGTVVLLILVLVTVIIVKRKLLIMRKMEVEDLTNRTEFLSKKLSELQIENDKITLSNSTLLNNIRTLSDQNNEYNAKIKNLEKTINTQGKTIADLKGANNLYEKEKNEALENLQSKEKEIKDLLASNEATRCSYAEENTKLVDEIESLKKEVGAAQINAQKVSDMEKAMQDMSANSERLQKENDELKLLEVENKILLKTVSRLEKKSQKKDATTSSDIKDDQTPQPQFILLEAGLMLSSDIKEDDVNLMSRKDLFALAKFYGLRNYAILSNEKLKEEIIKKL